MLQKKKKASVCPYCLHRYYEKKFLQKHILDCGKYPPLRIKFPHSNNNNISDEVVEDIEDIAELLEINEDIEEELNTLADEVGMPDCEDKSHGDILKFRHVSRKLKVPYVIYPDFECFILKADSIDSANDHVPIGFCCLTVCAYDFLDTSEAYVYSGPDPMDKFYKHIEYERKRIHRILKISLQMEPLKLEKQIMYDADQNCSNCLNFMGGYNRKVRHHDHLTGKFISATCNYCNLQLRLKKSNRKE